MSHGDEKHITKLLADQVKKQEHDRKAQAAHVPISKAEYLASKRLDNPETYKLRVEVDHLRDDQRAAEEVINQDIIPKLQAKRAQLKRCREIEAESDSEKWTDEDASFYQKDTPEELKRAIAALEQEKLAKYSYKSSIAKFIKAQEDKIFELEHTDTANLTTQATKDPVTGEDQYVKNCD
ncbi:unnamed protein product [Oikopleura dioica]|uniref:Uncharacterized protein n=1 Tax=Oikopleura dioica TaxID=34765 RepID=E4XTT3_OIKDI|nr:unnamed protein product [Oikopleura dioica]